MKHAAIYGAGGQGRLFYEALEKNGINCDYFVDQFSGLTELFGKPVFRLADVPDKGAARLYVSISCDDRTGADLNATLEKEGFGEVIDFVSSVKRHATILNAFADLSPLWIRRDPAEMLNDAKLAKVERQLCDDASHKCLHDLMTFRRSMTPNNYPMHDGSTEYLPSGIDLFSGIDRLRLADCGAYRGDTVEDFMGLESPEVDYIVSFEPDAGNLAKLRTVTERYAELRPEVRFFTFAEGVWSTPDILGLDSRGSSASTVVEEGAAVDNAVQVPVTSLDVALGGAAPNYIKMDVEGAERQALEGSREIIKRYKPVLAICVYHKPADLWELPLFIHEICPDYKMYLRLHSHMGTSAVLYCVAP